MNKHKLISALMSVVFLFSVISLSLTVYSADTRDYSGQFTDVSESDWFYKNVKKAYELNIINGKSDTTFDPAGNVTIAEAIKLAAVVHCYLENGSINEKYFASQQGDRNWYEPYLRYCRSLSIVTEEYPDYNAPATRAQIAVLFSRVIIYTETVFNDINSFEDGTFKDVDPESWYYGAFRRLYVTGIITGDEKGNINPDNRLKRSEMVAITVRMIDVDSRVDVTHQDADSNKQDDEKPNDEIPDDQIPDIVLTGESHVLYEGVSVKYAFSGLSFILGDFVLENTHVTLKNSYEIENINHIVLSEKSFSFRILYEGGYDATAIIRGWLTNSVSDNNEDSFNSKQGVFSLWLDGEPCGINDLSIKSETDYIEYTFNFYKPLNISEVKNIQFWLGRYNEELGALSGFDTLKEYVKPEHQESQGQPDDSDYSSEKSSAISGAEILFENENERCLILYGKGLYGSGSNNYSLILIFKDGSKLELYKNKLESIRINESGNVLYYTIIAPDGSEIQYGVNLKTN